MKRRSSSGFGSDEENSFDAAAFLSNIDSKPSEADKLLALEDAFVEDARKTQPPRRRKKIKIDKKTR